MPSSPRRPGPTATTWRARNLAAWADNLPSSVITHATMAAMQTMNPSATSRIVPLLAPTHTELSDSPNVLVDAYVKNAEQCSYGLTVPSAAGTPCWMQLGALSIPMRFLPRVPFGGCPRVAA